MIGSGFQIAINDEYSIDVVDSVFILYKNGVEISSKDISIYLDDTNLARIVDGTLDPTTGILTVERDDASTFTMDFSTLLDNQTLQESTDLGNTTTNDIFFQDSTDIHTTTNFIGSTNTKQDIVKLPTVFGRSTSIIGCLYFSFPKHSNLGRKDFHLEFISFAFSKNIERWHLTTFNSATIQAHKYLSSGDEYVKRIRYYEDANRFYILFNELTDDQVNKGINVLEAIITRSAGIALENWESGVISDLSGLTQIGGDAIITSQGSQAWLRNSDNGIPQSVNDDIHTMGKIGQGIDTPASDYHLYGSGVKRMTVQSIDNQSQVELNGVLGQFLNKVGNLYITNESPTGDIRLRLGSSTERIRIKAATGFVGFNLGGLNPTEVIDAVGNPRFRTGLEANGKTLQSDALGKGEWVHNSWLNRFKGSIGKGVTITTSMLDLTSTLGNLINTNQPSSASFITYDSVNQVFMYDPTSTNYVGFSISLFLTGSMNILGNTDGKFELYITRPDNTILRTVEIERSSSSPNTFNNLSLQDLNSFIFEGGNDPFQIQGFKIQALLISGNNVNLFTAPSIQEIQFKKQ